MKEFNALRSKARERRDKAIAEARADYEATLVQIAKLERSLSGTHTVRQPRISATIESVIPADRTFTTDDVLNRLRVIDPEREWPKSAIDGHISRLRERGILKRISRATIHERAVYARADLPSKEADSRTLRQVIAAVLTRPMNLAEIAVAVLESGYRTSQKGRHLRNHIAQALREGGFRRDGERWGTG